MDFLSQYGNMQPLSEGETKTFRAREAATQRPVLLHELSSNPRSGRQLHLLALVLRYTSSPHSEGHNPILAIEEQGDSLWVVTEDQPELANLWDWMERQSPKKASAEPLAPGSQEIKPLTSPEAIRESAISDERTAIFATRLASAGANPLVEFEAAENEGAHASEVSGASSNALKPGEKTWTTETVPGTRPGKTETDADTNMVPPPPSAVKPGDFTVMFQRPPAQGSAAEPQETTPKAEPGMDDKPGEFTMLFRRPAGSAASDQKPRFMGFTAPTTEKARFIETTRFKPEETVEMLHPEPQTPGAPNSPGDFTVMFESPRPGSLSNTQRGSQTGTQSGSPSLPDFPAPEVIEEIPNPLQPGEFTQVFHSRPAVPEAPRPAGVQNEPGAFTRIFQIPVGSDLLTSAEQGTVFSSAPVPASPPAWQPETPIAPSISPPAVPAATPAVASSNPPAYGGLPNFPIKAPAMPAMPQAPKLEIPHAGGASPKIPSFSAPKPPSFSLPKTPALPGIENAKEMTGPSILPLILVFGGIILVAVLLVLFFVTKH